MKLRSKEEVSGYWITLMRPLFASLLFMSNLTSAQIISDIKPWFNLQDLTYENPGCKNAWPLGKLDRWLKSHKSWIPNFNEPPYRPVPDTPWTGKITKKYYEEVARPSLAGGIGKGGTDVFSSTDMDKTVRDNQIIWLDIDGNGKCDFIGWDFSYTGMSARGEQGHTVYYIFFAERIWLQTDRPYGDRL